MTELKDAERTFTGPQDRAFDGAPGEPDFELTARRAGRA